jgi:ABC-type protease/lipase transport system fused ATPase/permease subunit
VVGHRPALMSRLDRIAVLQEGAVVALDTPAALLPQLIGAASAPRQPAVAASPTGAFA